MTAVTGVRPRSTNKSGWRSMVVTDDGVVLGHEDVTGDRDAGTQLDGARLLDDIGRLLEYAGALLPAEGGTVIVSRPPGGWVASPLVADARRDLEAMVADAAAAGWSTSPGERGYATGWFTFKQAKQPPIHLGIRPLLARSRTPLWDTDDATPEHIAHQLARFHAYTGAAFRQTPGVTGCAMIRDYYAGRGSNGFRRAEPLWHSKLPDAVVSAGLELRWSRPPTDAERERPHVVSFDMRAARCNAMGMVGSLPFGPLRHTGGALEFDPKMGGFWQVSAGELMTTAGLAPWWTTRALPVVTVAAADDAGRMWVTTPMMAWLERRRVRPLVHDAYVAEKSGQYLRYFRDQVRGALAKADGDATMTTAIKQVYQQTSGMFAATGGSIDNRGWNNTILDWERCSVLSGAERVWEDLGAWPMRCNVDELFYAVDDVAEAEQIWATLGGGPELGKWKIKTNVALADYCTRYKH